MPPTEPGPQLTREIADLARADGLVLFLGAGVNGAAGVMWRSLLSELLQCAVESAVVPVPSRKKSGKIVEAFAKDQEHDCYAQASIASMLLGPRMFVPTLRGIIYRRSDLKGLAAMCREAARKPLVAVDRLKGRLRAPEFGLLAALARLCMRPEIVAVVTYNYDTLLELAMESLLAARGSPPKPRLGWINRTPFPIARQIDHGRAPVPHPQLAIYHVHGCLPPSNSLTHLTAYPVVLSQQDYTRTMQDPYAWEESSQLHFLRSYPCLFLGLSMTDWNMLRLLQSAKAGRKGDHRLHCVGMAPAGLRQEIRTRLLAEFGISYHAASAGTSYAPVRGFTDELFFNLQNGTT